VLAVPGKINWEKESYGASKSLPRPQTVKLSVASSSSHYTKQETLYNECNPETNNKPFKETSAYLPQSKQCWGSDQVLRMWANGWLLSHNPGTMLRNSTSTWPLHCPA
jgi:hypothetical protein